MQECFLPHYNKRQTPVDMLVLHATCHADAHEVFESLDKLELSCHYFVDLNGRITRMVDEQKRAWHAGAGYWQGIDTDLNSHSIGIEIGNLSLGQQDFAEAQIEKLIPFCRKLIKNTTLTRAASSPILILPPHANRIPAFVFRGNVWRVKASVYGISSAMPKKSALTTRPSF